MYYTKGLIHKKYEGNIKNQFSSYSLERYYTAWMTMKIPATTPKPKKLLKLLFQFK